MKHKYINDFLGWPIYKQSKHIDSGDVFVSSNYGDTDIGFIKEVYFEDLKGYIDHYHELIMHINDIDDNILYEAMSKMKSRKDSN